MGNVYLALAHTGTEYNKLVALKALRNELSEDEACIKMFLDEARIAARLNHPNVIHTYETFDDDDCKVLAMEYLDGEALSRIVAKSGLQNSGPEHLGFY